MKIGIPKEIKNSEHRVALTPSGVNHLVERGHTVLVEASAGVGSGIQDEHYRAAGATIVGSAAEAWGEAELVCKVKEPIASEYAYLRDDLTLFTYLHLAADRPLTDALLEHGTTGIAYETVQLPQGGLPLLAPMSEVAGRLAPIAGAGALAKHLGGSGILLPGVPGVPPAKVTVIGAGIAGGHALQVAVGMRAEVTVLDISLPRLVRIDAEFGGRVRTVASSSYAIAEAVCESDLIIGAVLLPGARAPHLVSNALVAQAKPGSVLVDNSVVQGGCFEDTPPTTHHEPTYRVHDSIFYAVANMPGAFPVTSTHALTNATLPYLTALADFGWVEALRRDQAFAGGLNTTGGTLTNRGVGEAWSINYRDPAEIIA